MGLGAVFAPIAAGIAVAIVPPAQRGQALAFVFLGISLSCVVGVPLGAWLGLQYGWHTPIWVVVVLCALALAAVALRVPADTQAPGASFVGLGRLLARRDVLAVQLATLGTTMALLPLSAGSWPLLVLLLLVWGTAGGAIIGGALAPSLGFAQLSWAGVPFVAAALVVLRLDPTFKSSTTAKERVA